MRWYWLLCSWRMKELVTVRGLEESVPEVTLVDKAMGGADEFWVVDCLRKLIVEVAKFTIGEMIDN